MIYLLIGEESIIKKQIDDIKQKNNINFNSVINYDLEESSINNVIEELNTFNLFGDKKLVIVKNTNKIEDEIFINYLSNPSDNILVLTSEEELDKRKKVNKKILEVSNIINTKDIDLSKYIKEELKEYKIDIKDINLIKERCNNNFFKISNELDKLKLLKYEEKEITEKDILEIIKKSYDTNIYDLTNAINQKNIKKSLEVFYELLNNNEEELRILGSLANNYRTLLQIKNLTIEYKDEEIIDKLKMHPYRLKMLKKETNNYTKEELIKLIKQLGNIDINIKKGLVDKKDALELFLINL